MGTSTEAARKYIAENCMQIKIRPLKDEGQAIRDYATEHGCSVQALFLEAVREYMAQGKTPAEVKRGRKKANKD